MTTKKELTTPELDKYFKRLQDELDGIVEEGANLYGENFSHAFLFRSYLVGANLKRANFDHATLSWSDLRGANLSEANLEGAGLNNANLRGANLTGANLYEASLRGTNLEGMIIDDGEGNEYVLMGYSKGDK
tara:strand:- start:632 stop:1027 length:396 start_codon:yes stop_codon:yes gene_type:complete